MNTHRKIGILLASNNLYRTRLTILPTGDDNVAFDSSELVGTQFESIFTAVVQRLEEISLHDMISEHNLRIWASRVHDLLVDDYPNFTTGHVRVERHYFDCKEVLQSKQIIYQIDDTEQTADARRCVPITQIPILNRISHDHPFD